MALKTTHVVAIILVIVIAACAAVVLANGNNDSADYIDVKTSVVKGDDVQQVVIESNKDIFKEITTDTIIIFVTDLESYVHVIGSITTHTRKTCMPMVTRMSIME